MTSVRLSGGGGGKCEHGVPLYRSCAECEGRIKLPGGLEIGYVGDDDDDYDDQPEES